MRAWIATVALVVIAPHAHANPKQQACIFDALARVPAVPGLKVVDTTASIVDRTGRPHVPKDWRFHDIVVTVDVAGIRLKYKFICREDDMNQVNIIRREVMPDK